MKTFRTAFFSAFVAVLLGSQLGIAVDEQTQKDAASVLSKATTLVDIQTADGVPFVLLANVTLREGKKSADGLFAMSWAAPGRYRRVFRFPGFTATEVVSNGIIYRHRSTEALPLMIWELDNLLSIASAYRLRPHWKVRGIQTERSGGSDLTCVLTLASMTESRICVKTATGEPFSITRGIDAYRLEFARERSEYADYQTFEGRSFPRKLTFHGWDSQVVEVQIKKLIHVQGFSADEFMPPEGSTRTHYCEFPDTTGELRPSTGGTIPIGFSDVELDMYFQVSPTGGVRYAQVAYRSDPLKNKEILSWFTGIHFPIETCSGNPIAYETFVRFKSGH